MLWLIFACKTDDDTASLDRDVVFEPIGWQRGLPELAAEEIDIRTIVHLHSPHSHDACDGDPQPDGVLNEACKLDLRAALCDVRIDAAFLSDHPTHSTEVSEFKELFLIMDGDDPYYDYNGDVLANRITCADGHRTWLFAGVESSSMMPLGLQRHLTDVYDGGYDGSATAVSWVHEQGFISWVAHTETRTVEDLESLQLHGLELYQLHANLDPELRSEYLGLESLGFLSDVQPFFFPTPEDGVTPHPDLAFLAFVEENRPSIDKMEALGLKQTIGISAGTDAHQNVFPNLASDGERLDSYRRMMRWFNTRIQVLGDVNDPQQILEALKNRQTWIAFEIFGTPLGFEMQIQDSAQTYPIGTETNWREGQQLRMVLPKLHPESPQSNELPNIEGRLIYIDETGRETLHTWTEGAFVQPVEQPGIYRLEIWIQPKHLTPYLGDYGHLADRWVPWIYSGAFFIR